MPGRPSAQERHRLIPKGRPTRPSGGPERRGAPTTVLPQSLTLPTVFDFTSRRDPESSFYDVGVGAPGASAAPASASAASATAAAAASAPAPASPAATALARMDPSVHLGDLLRQQGNFPQVRPPAPWPRASPVLVRSVTVDRPDQGGGGDGGGARQAIEAYTRALSTDPSNGEVLRSLAFCFMMIGEAKRAWATYQDALAHMPSNLVTDAVPARPSAQCHAGSCWNSSAGVRCAAGASRGPRRRSNQACGTRSASCTRSFSPTTTRKRSSGPLWQKTSPMRKTRTSFFASVSFTSSSRT